MSSISHDEHDKLIQKLVSPMRDSTFPQDILIEILKRLPAKSLVRLRGVSKLFCSLITDPLFSDVHRKWSLTIPGRTSIFIPLPGLYVYYTINFIEETNGNLRAKRVRYMYGKYWEGTSLESFANGLLCLSKHHDPNNSLVCNLSTRKHTFLPRISMIPDSVMLGRTLLGFDPISKRYKVLKLIRCNDDPGNPMWKHWVFTLGVDTL